MLGLPLGGGCRNTARQECGGEEKGRMVLEQRK